VNRRLQIGDKKKLKRWERLNGIRPNFSSSFGFEKNQRGRAFKKGLPLLSHQKACHGGVFDPACPACKELKKKLDF